MKEFGTFDHGADIGIYGIGKTKDESFKNIGKALFDLVVDIDKVQKKRKVRFVINGIDDDILLVNFLNELIYLKDVKNLVFCDFIISVRPKRLECIAFGEKFDKTKHNFKIDVKAATLSKAKVYTDKENYICECVVDV